MRQLRPNCECCNTAPDARHARIRSFGCAQGCAAPV